MRRTVFFISDSTGITAETIGNSILAQFEGVQFDKHRLPFTDNPHKAEVAALRIKTNYAQTGHADAGSIWWNPAPRNRAAGPARAPAALQSGIS